MAKAPTKSITGPQLKTSASVLITPTYAEGAPKTVGELPKYDQSTLTPTKIRAMRKDPTIALVRNLFVAPALLAPWSYEEKKGAPKGAVDFIEEQLTPLRSQLIRQALLGCVDFGWAPFEKVFKKVKTKIGLRLMKSLIQDWTEIVVNADDGMFAGFIQPGVDGAEIYLPLPQSFVHTFDPEGTYWYGQSYMANAEDPYDSWTHIGDASDRYDAKIAGSHWVIHYPMGTSTWEGSEDVDNEYIARQILSSLQSSGMIAVPKALENFIAEANERTPNAWEIELISDSGATSASFTDRQTYYDKLKVRAFGFPERSILEGQFGTKAEAAEHGDFAIANVLLRAEDFVQSLNLHVVNQLLRLNWGPDKENLVIVKAGTLGDANREFLQSLYVKLLDKPEGFTAEFDNVDRAALRDALGIPTDEEAEADDIRESDRLRDRIREREHNNVDGPEQRFGRDSDGSPDDVGAGDGGRDPERTAEEESVHDTVQRDDPEADNGRSSETGGDPPV